MLPYLSARPPQVNLLQPRLSTSKNASAPTVLIRAAPAVQSPGPVEPSFEAHAMKPSQLMPFGDIYG